ncbi:hypothetical protein [Methanobrevibacter sp.]|uniref:hypothetical protein n=1 Tax=Methanobrevibacter sp. TaxID=66852 RepID=UPI0038694DC7
MELNFTRFSQEIIEFICADTIRDIDYGILDLSYVKDIELKDVLYFLEEVLTLELKVNYLENNTGIFRVQLENNRYYYREFGYVIEADSLVELKELVLAENRVWYIFDYDLLESLKKFRKEVVL